MGRHLGAMDRLSSLSRRQIATYTLAVIIIGLVVAVFIYNNPFNFGYRAVAACNLLTPSEAQDLLGDKVISVNTAKPSTHGDMATSKCSYTDTNQDKSKMLVAAVAVQSAMNKRGVKTNKTDFESHLSDKGIKKVDNLGDSAFFDEIKGQLNVLSGRQWIIMSFGVGEKPASNTLADAIKLAHKVLN